MKREGRQHGVVRSYPILLPTADPLLSHQQLNKRHVKTVDAAYVTGLFTKVSRKPTNHSKFTGKCGKAQCLGCHIHPATKSKDKSKGTMKLRSIGCDHGQIGYPVGTSATGVLDDMVGDRSYDDGGVEYYDYNYDYGYDYDIDIDIDTAVGVVMGNDQEDVKSDEYCDVGLCWGDGDDYDGWYLVGHSH